MSTKNNSGKIKHCVTVYEKDFIIAEHNEIYHKYRKLKAKQDDFYNHYLFDEGDELEDTLESYRSRMKVLKRRFKFSFSIPKIAMVEGLV